MYKSSDFIGEVLCMVSPSVVLEFRTAESRTLIGKAYWPACETPEHLSPHLDFLQVHTDLSTSSAALGAPIRSNDVPTVNGSRMLCCMPQVDRPPSAKLLAMALHAEEKKLDARLLNQLPTTDRGASFLPNVPTPTGGCS